MIVTPTAERIELDVPERSLRGAITNHSAVGTLTHTGVKGCSMSFSFSSDFAGTVAGAAVTGATADTAQRLTLSPATPGDTVSLVVALTAGSYTRYSYELL